MNFHPAQCRDFCLWPYQPPAPPAPDALDGAAPLLAAARHAGCGEDWATLVADLRQALGPYATVWGLKQEGGAHSVELYFYDYARHERRVSLSRALAGLGRFVQAEVEVDEALPYFMVSIELPLALGALPHRVREVDVYIGNPGSSVSSGICYRVDETAATTMKNFYFFFDRAKQWAEIKGKLACGIQVGRDAGALDRLLPDWLAQCQTIVVANKRHGDALYFSRITVAQLTRWLREFGWPDHMASLFERQAPRFRHMLFDVGFDFALCDGRVSPGKSSWYGVF